MIAQALACAVGLWITAAPDLLGLGGAARISGLTVGPLAASFACVAVWEAGRGLRWVNAALGAWLALSPALLGHDPRAAANDVASGLLLTGLSLLRGRPRLRMGGGWRALFK